ncbi:hypothetical protein BC827DRAFT_812319 [Russula dissimulans]|nr:hypothetical protein BC827DRAFT_812319 [Russula dissimulans]
MTFTFAQLSTMTPQISLEGPGGDLTPKPIKPPQPSSLDVNPIPLTLGDPSSMFDDSPSPLSSLSSLSEFDRTPPPDSDVYTPNVELTSGFPQVTHPLPPATPRGPTKKPDFALTQAGRISTTSPRNRGESGLAKPSSSVRLTRSASIKQKEAGSVAGSINDKPQGIPSEPSVPSLIPAKRPSDLPGLAPDFSKKSSASVSNKKAFSFAMPTSSSLNKTIGKAPAPSLHQKPSSLPKRQPPKLPSPMKPASSLGPGEPSHPSKYTGLSNLSLALEKLKIPPPLRPATTLGFNSDTRFASNALDSESAPKVKDDSAIRLGNGLPSGVRASTTPLRRVATIGSVASFEPKSHASGSKPTAPPARSTDPGPPMKRINLHSGIIVGKHSHDKPKGFVYGGVGKMRQFEKVSKKSSLPVVEGSPVKGAESALASNWDEQDLPSTSGIRPTVLPPHKEVDGRGEASTVLAAVEPMKLQEAVAEHSGVLGADSSSLEDGQAESADAWKHASRRASLASQFLQQTLAVLPSTPPPPKAKSKATERPQSSTRSGLRSRSSSNAGGSQSVPRGLPKAQEVDATTSRPASTTTAPSSSNKPSSLKVLKACTIFVDVRTDDGDDAGGLFVDMLKGLGAKIIGRAGQSCTHIVYKNGLMSTLSKYRLMREPKPFVVGISWVVECVEQCRRVGEENFLVDLEGLNIAGNNKRRRSMLPKHISSSMQPPPSRPGSSLAGTLASDQSMDRSSVGPDHSLNSSDGLVEDEDDLPPLERARQRRNIFFKS